MLESMAPLPPLPRSPVLMSTTDTAVLIVDIQEKLIPRIQRHNRIVWNSRRLLEAAQVLDMIVAATEQYPRGLGGTVPELSPFFNEIPEKLTFSCGGCAPVLDHLQSQEIHRVLVAGIESHVCVQQTVFDLMSAGFQVYLAVDAVGSRNQLDHEIALRRMESGGAVLTTTESAVFEWCQQAGTPEFKQISALAKQTAPDDA